MAYRMAATIVTLNDLERYLSVAGLFKCNPSNICAAFYTISTDSVLARFLCTSRASCSSTDVEDSHKNLTSGCNKFNDFPGNQMTKFHAEFPNFM